MRYVALLFVLFFLPAHAADPLAETRYCGAPSRYSDGSIKRSSAVVAAFKRAHPCPATGIGSGACPGWSIDHVIPLACGGCDAVSNMAWMPLAAKSCASSWCKDRFERKVYAATPPVPDTPSCSNVVISP